MKRVGAMATVIWLMAVSLHAQEVQAVFTLPAGFEDRAVSWSATPLDLSPDADVLDAMMMKPEAATGPWIVVLAPGPYMISAFSEVEVFELTATVAPQPSVQSFEVPVLSLESIVAIRCEGAGPCAFDDPATGLGFDLPGGWAAEQPYFADLGAGEKAKEVSVVFFEDVTDDGGSVWFLNPVDWVEDDAGPCRDVAAGVLCTFDLGGQAEAGFAIIAPSLTLAPVTP